MNNTQAEAEQTPELAAKNEANVDDPEHAWQLVPRMHEGRSGLTDEMMRAFYKAFDANYERGDFERLNAGYNAMLRSAPIGLMRSDCDTKTLRAIDEAIRGNVNDPGPLNSTTKVYISKTTYGLVKGLLRERDSLKAALRPTSES